MNKSWFDSLLAGQCACSPRRVIFAIEFAMR